MTTRINQNTTLCISLAARPSEHGMRFHNFLYERHGLNYIYKAIAPADITAAVVGMRGLNIRGAGVSMPYKQDVIPLIDRLDASAERIQAVNTIVNTDGELVGYNTDYLAVRTLLASRGIPAGGDAYPVALRGSGGMASAVVAALNDHGLRGTIVARNEQTGTRLAERYGWDYATTTPAEARLLVNATPIGMAGSEDTEAFSSEEIGRADAVMECVAHPVDTLLVKRATERGLTVLTGADIIALQAAKQFELYTGVTLSDRDVADAEAYAQQVA